MKKTNATLSIYELRCKLNTDLALKKITKEEKEKLEKYLELDRKEKDYLDNSEANFIKDLDELFCKWDLMLNCDIGINGRIEFINGELKKFFYFPTGYNGITEKEIKWLPRISKRREIFDKIKLNQTVHIDDIRPILKEITNVDRTSLFYKSDKEFKEMCDALKEKYNLY